MKRLVNVLWFLFVVVYAEDKYALNILHYNDFHARLVRPGTIYKFTQDRNEAPRQEEWEELSEDCLSVKMELFREILRDEEKRK